ncbi:MAG: cell division protein FtsA [Barnesiella sp.]
MEAEKYIVALELGSSKITGLAGYKNEEGQLVVSAIEKEDIAEYIKRGCIVNVRETAGRVKKIITKLENRIAPHKITKLYVGISGQSLHSIDTTIPLQLPEDTQITDSIIERIIAESKRIPVANTEIISVLPTEYIIDNRPEKNPVGVFGSNIEANLKLIVAKPSLKKNIDTRLVEEIKLPVAGFILTPIVSASQVLTDEEKKLGCILVDFGAETTTVSIYKNDYLRYLVTIPLGSRNITRDIASLNVTESDAERIKILLGDAMGSRVDKDMKFNIEGIDSTQVNLNTCSRVIEARIEEIVENVLAQIRYAKFDNKQLSAGIIIIGGGSKLKNIQELLAEKSGMKVRKGSLRKDIIIDSKERNTGIEFIEGISILAAGNNICTVLPKQDKVEKEEEFYVPSKKEDKKKLKKIKEESHKNRNPFGGIVETLKNVSKKLLDESDEQIK